MDINTFQLKMLGKSLVMVTDQDIVFRRKHGRWALWNSETEDFSIPPVESGPFCISQPS